MNDMTQQDHRFAFRYDQWVGWVLGLLGSGRSRSWVDVHDEEVEVRLGIAFSSTVSRSSIVSVSGRRGRVLGWGAHGWRGRWLVNGSSKGLVVLHLEPPARGRVLGFPVTVRELALSLENPLGFCHALELEFDSKPAA